jgi:parallel beta-helix repeat protein
MSCFIAFCAIFVSGVSACPPAIPDVDVQVAADNSPCVGETVYFDASDSICADPGILEFTWHFPPEAYFIQIYGSAGEYAKCKFYPAGPHEMDLTVKNISTGQEGNWQIQYDSDPLQTDNYSINVSNCVSTWYVRTDGNDDNNGQSWDYAFRNIQTAIDFASDGDTILVREGTYYEQLDMKGKNLDIRSSNNDDEDELAPDTTIIDANKQGTAVLFRGSESGSPQLKGFTIRNGFPEGDGLQLHMTFDDSSNRGKDDSGKERQSQISGSPTSTTGYMGEALQFNGTTDYITMNDFYGVVGSHSRTTSAWIKTSYTGDYQMIISWGDSQDGQAWMMGFTPQGKLLFSMFGSDFVGNTIGLNNGQWRHVAVVFKGDTNEDGRLWIEDFTFYVDGKSENLSIISQTGASLCTSDNLKVTIGVRNYNNNPAGWYFKGLMDDVRVYSRALDESEILPQADYSNPVAHWTMDDYPRGTQITDSSLCKYVGQITRAEWESSAYYNSGLNFQNSSSSYVSISYAEQLNPGTLTLSLWANISNSEGQGTWRSLISSCDYVSDQTSGYVIYAGTDEKWQFWTGNGTPSWDSTWDTTGSLAIQYNTWTHIVATFEPTVVSQSCLVGTRKLYINGTLVAIKANSSYKPCRSTTRNLMLGSEVNENYYTGKMDEVRIYNRVLSIDEIQFLSNHHPNLKVYYKFDEDWLDYSGNNNTAVLHSSVERTSEGVFGQCAQFTAANSTYLTIGGTSTSYSQYSVSLWYKKSDTLQQPLFQNSDAFVSDASGRPQISTYGFVSVAYCGDSYYTGGVHKYLVSYANEVNSWHHLVLTVDTATSTMCFYEDGVLSQIRNDTPTGNLDLTKVEFGARSSRSSFYTGNIDEVQIYDKVLTPQEILLLAVPQPTGTQQGGSLVGNWKLDGNTEDTTGNHDGEFIGTESYAQGNLGQSAAIQVDSGYVNMGNNDAFDFPGAFTLSVWAQPSTAITEVGRIVYRYDANTNDGYTLSYDPVSWRFYCSRTAYNYALVMSDSAPVNGVWTHIVGRREENGLMTLFINGVKQSATAVMRGPIDSEGDLLFGVDYNTNYDFLGNIDEVSVYNYALNDQQIQQEYQKGKFGIGGGIRSNGTEANITQCIVKQNTSSQNGGGIYGVNGVISNNYILENTALNADGGGLANCNSDIINCIIANNTAQNAGAMDDCDADIINCTVVKNSANITSGLVGGLNKCNGNITNTIIWNNSDSATTGTAQDKQIKDYTTDNVAYCCIKDWISGGTGNNATLPGTDFDATTIDIDGTDSILGTLDDGLMLKEASPCIDAGYEGTSDPVVSHSIQTDIAGLERKNDGDHNGTDRTDIGAYEYRKIIYVDCSVASNGTGSSWDSAFKYLNAALDPLVATSGCEIWVADGTYKPGQDDSYPDGQSTATFTIPANVKLYGGFSGNEKLRFQRNSSANVTELNGQIGIVYCLKVVDLLDNTNVDGFIIKSGKVGVSCTHNNCTINNCTIRENVFISSGGRGIDIQSANNVRITNCEISNNEAAGIFISTTYVSTIRSFFIKDCSIKNNGSNKTSSIYGVCISLGNSNHSAIVEKCNISNNINPSNSNQGYGIQVGGTGIAGIYNCEVNGSAWGISSTSWQSTFQYCKIYQNKYGVTFSGTGGVHTLKNFLIYGNTIYGLYGYNSSADVFLSTISNNAIGVYQNPSSTGIINITNSIVYSNTTDLSIAATGSANAYYSCIGNMPSSSNISHFSIITSDPKFANPANGDFYLKSEFGRWNPATNQWVKDARLDNSPCIDSGQPWADYSQEPVGANGNRVNMGAFGNTTEASKSIDSDNDEISDIWEYRCFGDLSQDKDDDSEPQLPDDLRDGISNLGEYYFNYNPKELTDLTGVPAKMFNVQQLASSFNPTKGEIIGFDFYINKSSFLTLKVNNQLAMFDIDGISYAQRRLPPGRYTINWKGKTEFNGDSQYLIMLKGANYPWQFFLDSSGSVGSTTSSIDTLFPLTLNYDHKVENVYCNPSRIIPIFNELATISYQTSFADITSWPMTITIYDPDGNQFYQKITDSLAAGSHPYIWNGKSGNGRYPSKNGKYTVEVRFSGMREKTTQTINVFK